MRRFRNILVTGGLGFIGSNFIRYILNEIGVDGVLVNVDKMTYAGNSDNLRDISKKYLGKYHFIRTDICNFHQMSRVFRRFNIDLVVNFAAESHVDRSIFDPGEFVRTNILGTFALLEVCRKQWKNKTDVLFHHISTDEVYGSLGDEGYFVETTPYNPRSPYAASKASADHMVRAYNATYGIPTTISNSSNNYGPYQYPEKFIPLTIQNMIEGKAIPLYGNGENIRDWIFVRDHVEAIWTVINRGEVGQHYNVSALEEWSNIDLLKLLCNKMSLLQNKPIDHFESLITFVSDRPGHDKRYAMKRELIEQKLGWKSRYSLDEGLDITIRWYLEGQQWVRKALGRGYRRWINANYAKRIISR